MHVKCVSCGAEAKRVGKIPQGRWFGGKPVPIDYPEGALYHCPACHIRFRWPRPAVDDLRGLYRGAVDDHWCYDARMRPDWQWSLRDIGIAKARSILDIGCFDGAFLDLVREPWARFGIEVHEAAARRAADRGVRILGDDVNDLGHLPAERFGAVVAHDVVEHVPDPLVFLRAMARLCAPEGVCVLSTGNSDWWTWTVKGSRHWYCTIPEHLSFIGEKWCRYVAPGLGLRLVDLRYFSHRPGASFGLRLGQAGANFVDALWPAATALGRRARGMVRGEPPQPAAGYPPMWDTSRDHVYCVFARV